MKWKLQKKIGKIKSLVFKEAWKMKLGDVTGLYIYYEEVARILTSNLIQSNFPFTIGTLEIMGGRKSYNVYLVPCSFEVELDLLYECDYENIELF